MAAALTEEEMLELVGDTRVEAWEKIRGAIEDRYEMETLWSSAFGKWKYEFKYRRGGKTLCALYARESETGIMLIFGKKEREKVEAIRDSLSEKALECYDSADTYHDGKWVMFPAEEELIEDLMKLLAVKRRPNKKLCNN